MLVQFVRCSGLDIVNCSASCCSFRLIWVWFSFFVFRGCIVHCTAMFVKISSYCFLVLGVVAFNDFQLTRYSLHRAFCVLYAVVFLLFSALLQYVDYCIAHWGKNKQQATSSTKTSTTTENGSVTPNIEKASVNRKKHRNQQTTKFPKNVTLKNETFWCNSPYNFVPIVLMNVNLSTPVPDKSSV